MYKIKYHALPWGWYVYQDNKPLQRYKSRELAKQAIKEMTGL